MTKSALETFNLAVLRTELANRRTLLAFAKTSIGLAISAAGLLKFSNEGSVYELCGVALLVAAFVVLIWGVEDYRRSSKLILQEKEIVYAEQGSLLSRDST
ncbi:DUF202 domain-containing protein [Halodesulfovibrio spirochaetisodalis]|uniref:DUF202 domain-containing protein n=1 Tax=Halodesulfovibrio spirochaetisodalis TaxID=1560234 RepID=A0A1B7XD38_9BACT|nr:DUF202 domain-containing protein [Halodesulfovibrio spirochaetisodalis]OBQ51910.1 hypothetical protein SP90_08750 [Halodesulfovibrio spirochaetisodalis]